MADTEDILLSRLEPLLNSLKVMTIATPWDSGVWSAPVYYLYRNRAFWFFSSPDSRHIRGAALSPDMVVAASIFMDDLEFNRLKGVQMGGQIEAVVKCGNLTEVAAYIVKFGIPFKISSGGGNGNLEDARTFIEQSYRSCFYRFVPKEIFYMDNTIHIGFKQKIIL